MGDAGDKAPDTIGRMLAKLQGSPGGPGGPPAGRSRFRLLAILGALVLLFLLARLSWIQIGADQVGHLKRIYAVSELPSGRIVALAGQKARRRARSARASTSSPSCACSTMSRPSR